MAITVQKQTATTSKVREHELTPHPRRKQKCTTRPGRRPRCGGWQKSMWNRAI